MLDFPSRVQHIHNFGVFLAYECVGDGQFQGYFESLYPFAFSRPGLLL